MTERMPHTGAATNLARSRGRMTERMPHSRAVVTTKMLRTRPGGSVLLAVLCFVLAAVVAAVPVALSALGDATVRDAAATLAPGARDLEASASGFPQAGPGAAGDETGAPGSGLAAPDVWGQWNARLEALRTEIGDPLEQLLGSAQYYARTQWRAAVLEGADGHNTVTLALDPRMQERATLVEGEWPAPPAAFEFVGFAGTGDGGDQVREPVDIVLSVRAAAELEWPIGEVRGDVLAPGGAQSGTDVALPLRLTGLFDAGAGTDDYWYHVPSVLIPRMWVDGGGNRHVDATGFIAPEALTLLQGDSGVTTVWYPFDSTGITAADAPRVLQQLREFTANAQTVGSQSAGIGGVLSLSFRTDAITTIDRALATARAMAAVVAITASGPAGVAVAVLVLACRIIARSRRSALALLAARGASPERLRGILAAHGAWFGAVPAVLGGAGVVAIALVSGIPPTLTMILLPLAVALLPVAILAAMPPPPPGLREQIAATPTATRRLLRATAETVVVVVTLLATAALVSGALGGVRVGATGSWAAAAGADLLVSAVPLLWGLVGCVVALRLYPLPLRALLDRLRRGPGLVGFLGAARAVREPAAGVAPVLALVIGMSSAVTSGVLLGSIQHGIDTTARVEVGADLQVARIDIDAAMTDRLRGVDGVAAVAPVAASPSAYVRAGRDLTVMTLLLADTAELLTAQDPEYPLIPTGADLGAGGATIPVVVSERAAAALDRETRVTLDGAAAEVMGVGVAAAPGAVGPVWVLADIAHAEELIGTESPIATSALIGMTSGSDAAQVQASVRDIVGPDAVITTPAGRSEALSTSTGALAIRVALIAATAGVALLGALTVVLTLALGAAGRARLVTLLRVLGAPPRASTGLVAWELWPGVAAAIVVGTAVGLGLPALLLWTVDLTVFTGAVTPAYHLDPLLLGGAVLGFVALTALFTLAALALTRRVRASTLLRTSQEG